MSALEKEDIYVSTKTACSTSDISDAVYAITGSEEKAKTSIRISISYLTTKEDIDKFLDILKISLRKLSKLNKNM